MTDNFILPLIDYMNAINGEWISIYLFLFCALSILLMLRLFGDVGLYVYSATATILANIQVLKLGTLSLFPEPIALGTITFSTVFLTSDIITEHYGKAAAYKSVWINFSIQIITTVIMLFIIGTKPIEGDIFHNALEALFLPSPRLIASSLIAFVASQLLEITLFQAISNISSRKMLWLRTNASVMISSLVDNIIFSLLAWVILAPNPVSTHTLIYTYILGTYIIRLVLSLFSTPIMYLSYYFTPRVK